MRLQNLHCSKLLRRLNRRLKSHHSFIYHPPQRTGAEFLSVLWFLGRQEQNSSIWVLDLWYKSKWRTFLVQSCLTQYTLYSSFSCSAAGASIPKILDKIHTCSKQHACKGVLSIQINSCRLTVLLIPLDFNIQAGLFNIYSYLHVLESHKKGKWNVEKTPIFI